MEQSTPTFEEAIRRLEEIVDLMNSPTTSLDASLNLYEEADALLKVCSLKIEEVEKRVRQLSEDRIFQKEESSEIF